MINTIKIKLLLFGYLKHKYLSNAIEISCNEPIIIYQILKNAKIGLAEGIVAEIEGLIVDKKYIIRQSCVIKLFPIIGGG